MNYHQILTQTIASTRQDVLLFMPELLLCGTILLMLLVRLFNFARRLDMFWIALVGSLAALTYALPWNPANAEALKLLETAGTGRHELFTGMLVYDSFTVFFRSLLTFFAVLFVLLCKLTGIPDKDDSPDFYTLVLGAIVGMCLMASVNHLFMVFMAVELASVPSYALAGYLKGRRQSSEASLKYVVYGAGTAGIMLYGISLLAGVTGSAHLPTVTAQLAAMLGLGIDGGTLMVLVLAGLMISVGIAFKLSAVPFHFWCPDVFEGASAEVNALLSVASKSAALALLVRVVVGLGTLPAGSQVALYAPPQQSVAMAQENIVPASSGGRRVERVQKAAEPVRLMTGPGALDALAPVRDFTYLLVAIMAAVTCTFGNLAAYGQTNIKRLLAYSTIAHAGYMMMPVAAGIYLMGTDAELARRAFASLLVYAGIYLFMNLGAFAIVAFLRNAMGSEQISDYAGLVRVVPWTSFFLAVILFGLIGIPPLAGFIGKFAIFEALVRAEMYVLFAIGGVNTVIALFYYMRVIKLMMIDPEPEDRLPFALPMLSVGYAGLVSLPVLLLIFQWNGLYELCSAACRHLVP